MRSVTQYAERVYKAKSSARRAARNAVGSHFEVEVEEFWNRFRGDIALTESMIGVEACEGGWRWFYTFDLANVRVYIVDESGKIVQRQFESVSHWPTDKGPVDDPLEGIKTMIADYDRKGESEYSAKYRDKMLPGIHAACRLYGVDMDEVRSPSIEMATVDTSPVEPLSLPELTERIEFYKDSVKSIAASKGNEAVTDYINRELPQLKAACEAFGVTMSDVGELLVMVRNAAKSTDPSSIARVMVKAEPYGLHHRLERQLTEQASKRRLSVAYCLQSARDYLQRCAV